MMVDVGGDLGVFSASVKLHVEEGWLVLHIESVTVDVCG
jgi:hypothetical protein